MIRTASLPVPADATCRQDEMIQHTGEQKAREIQRTIDAGNTRRREALREQLATQAPPPAGGELGELDDNAAPLSAT